MYPTAHDLKMWKENGFREEQSISIPDRIKRLPWSHAEDRMRYDILPNVYKLQMPTLLLVGEKDIITPVIHQKLLFDKLPGKKEFHIIKNAPHTFREHKHLQEIKNIMKKWIEETNN